MRFSTEMINTTKSPFKVVFVRKRMTEGKSTANGESLEIFLEFSKSILMNIILKQAVFFVLFNIVLSLLSGININRSITSDCNYFITSYVYITLYLVATFLLFSCRIRLGYRSHGSSCFFVSININEKGKYRWHQQMKKELGLKCYHCVLGELSLSASLCA
jgi:hypothetical protein